MVISPVIAAALSAVPALYLPALRPALLALAFCLLAGSVCFFLFSRKPGGSQKPGVVFFRRQSPGYIRLCIAAVLGILAALCSVSLLPRFAPGLPPETIRAVKGKLLDDPRSFALSRGRSPEEERGMAVMELTESGNAGSNSVRTSAGGRALVYFPAGTMPRLRGFGRGAELYVEGRFLPDRPAAGAAPVPRFQASSVHVVKAAPALEQARTAVRTAVLSRLKPKAWGGLAAALLIGTRENLEGSLAQSFRDAGISHILALSGMHLAFLSALLALALKKPLGKKGAVTAGLVFIILYVFLVGPQPSLVRAAIMYVMGSCLVLSGTVRQPLVLLCAAFLIQILLDPSSAYSISFILSYLTLGGILVLGGGFESLLRGRLPDPLAGGLGVSAAAFLAAAPVVAAFFGTLRPAGLAAGLAAAPLSGIFMALSLLWLCAANIPFLGTILDFLLWGLYTLFRWCVSLFAGAPGFKAEAAAVCIAAALLIVCLFVAANLQKRYRNELAPFTAG